MGLKKRIKRIVKKTHVGNTILQRMGEKDKRLRIIEETVEAVKNWDKMIIFGSDEMARNIDSKIGGCSFFIDFDAKKGLINNKPIKKYEDIIFLDDLDEYKIIVVPCRTVVLKIDALLQVGIEWNQIVLSESWALFLGGKGFDCYDMMLGYTRSDDLAGFTVFDDDNLSGEKYTIVTLGGSTTDPYTANVKSWSEFFYLQLKDMGLEVRVVCGGLSGYHSGQEFIKLFRDVLPMKPDMVISYSGINDTDYFHRRSIREGHPYTTQYQIDFLEYSMKNAMKHGYFDGSAYHSKIGAYTLGIEDAGDFSERWVKNERMMHALCDEFGIKFHAFLQPNRDYGGYIKTGEPEKSSYAKNLSQNLEEVKSWYDKTRSLIAEIDYITDLSELFSGQKHIFYDYCHVFESGNRKIETAIFKHVIKDIREDYRKKQQREGC